MNCEAYLLILTECQEKSINAWCKKCGFAVAAPSKAKSTGKNCGGQGSIGEPESCNIGFVCAEAHK